MGDIVNINGMFERELCTQCGTCYSLCPKGNIDVKRSSIGSFVFHVKDEARCVGCGICYEVCPGHEVDFDELNSHLFPEAPADPFMGSYKSTFLAQSTDEGIRNSCASGGVISSLLMFALDRGLISGAVVVRMSERNPLEPEVFVAKGAEEVLSASQSKYLPVPMNIGLREVMEADEGRFALVGLPCHIHGLRKAELLFPKLRERIVLCLGLLCGPGPSLLMTEYLIRRAGLRVEEVAKVKYREKPHNRWPGGMLITAKTGEKRYIPLENYLYAQTLFTLPRCGMCPDFSNELADLSFGDAHLPEFRRNMDMTGPEGEILRGRDGWNIVISRTERGEKLLREAAGSGAVRLVEIDPRLVVRSQKWGFYYKKRAVFARMNIRKALRQPVPRFKGLKPPEGGLRVTDYIKPILFLLIQRISITRLGSLLLGLIPERILMRKFRFKQRLMDRACRGYLLRRKRSG